MILEKSHYAVNEAAEYLGYTVRDLIHLAAKEEITLIIGVPDGIRFRTYDSNADRTELPALLEPQLLALSASQCQKIELNGRTEQSDFRVGYLSTSDGGLQRLMPSYGGRTRLDHGWAFWRTYRGPYVKEIELIPERLFVVGDDMNRLAKSAAAAVPAKAAGRAVGVSNSAPASPTKSDQGSPATQLSRRAPLSVIKAESPTVSKSVQVEKSTPMKTGPIFIRMKELERRTGLKRSTIYDKLDSKSSRYDPTFPKQRILGTGSVAWVEAEVEAWMNSRVSAA